MIARAQGNLKMGSKQRLPRIYVRLNIFTKNAYALRCEELGVHKAVTLRHVLRAFRSLGDQAPIRSKPGDLNQNTRAFQTWVPKPEKAEHLSFCKTLGVAEWHVNASAVKAFLIGELDDLLPDNLPELSKQVIADLRADEIKFANALKSLPPRSEPNAPIGPEGPSLVQRILVAKRDSGTP
jgi:hypothetical protein